MHKITSSEPQPHDELPPPYRIAVETILAEPMPEFDFQRLAPVAATPARAEPSRRRWLTRACGMSLAAAAAALLLASLFAVRPIDAWAQVIDSVRKQPWVRMQTSSPDGSAQVEVWWSPKNRIAAGRFPGSAVFLELDQHRLQRFDSSDKTIYVSEPTPGDLDHFSALEAVLEALANHREPGQPDSETFKLLSQTSRKSSAGDERFTDYVLEYEHARRVPSFFRRVFRVPEGSELPSSMTEEWTWEDKPVARAFKMDYPDEGPADLFALDVPKDAKVVDTRSGKELNELLTSYSKQQTKPIEPYSATVLVGFDGFKYLANAFRVHCTADDLTAAAVDGEQLSELNSRIADGEVRRPDDVDATAWWEGELAKLAFGDVGSQSGMMFPHQVNYPLLGLPNQKARATLNPKPFAGPFDCQLLTIEGAVIGNRRYWLDPERGSMVVRWEHEPAGRKPGDWMVTTIVDSAEKSPGGRWYPTEVRYGQVESSGDDLRAVAGVAPVATQVYRYLIKFE